MSDTFQKPKTYPHSIIAEKCEDKYETSWDQFACIINSLELYYGKVTQEELEQNAEKFVIVPTYE